MSYEIRSSLRGSRTAVSLLEIVIASAILTAALIPVMSSFHTLVFGFKRTHESTHGAFLAQSVMENIRYRLYNQDTRYAKLNATDEERQTALDGKAYEQFFRALQSSGETTSGCWVTERDGQTSPYFAEFENLAGTGLHPIGVATNPLLSRALEDYAVGVHVFFDSLPAVPGVPAAQTSQFDRAQLKVMVSWRSQADEYRESSFETVLTRYQYEPHE